MSLSMTRGRSKILVIRLTAKDGTPLTLGDGETLIWGLKKELEDSECIITRSFTQSDYDDTAGGFVVTILPSETEPLEPGRYIFDAGIQRGADSYVDAVVATTLRIYGAVTERST